MPTQHIQFSTYPAPGINYFMKTKDKLGKKGEELAEKYLQLKGMLIVERNWRYRHWEIDLVGTRNGILHFVEVKTRRTSRGGPPEGRVDRKKFRFLQQAAEAYLAEHPGWKLIQFDIVSVILPAGGNVANFFILEDVFFWD